MSIKNNNMADNTIHIQEEPKLPEAFENARRNHGGQTVPADFFAQFEKKMNAAIDADILLKEAEKKAAEPKIQWYQSRRTWLGLAASFLIIVVLGIALQFDRIGHYLSESPEATQLANIQDAEEEDDFFDVPEMVEESYLASTNDFELYEYYCDVL